MDMEIRNQRQSKEYKLWNNMITRCYSKKYHEKFPSYKDCFVEEYLMDFNNFKLFVNNLVGFGCVDSNSNSFQMDKDILSNGDKCYSRETICFVPQQINYFLLKNDINRGKLLLGVYERTDRIVTNKYYAQVKIDGKRTHLGSFKTELEAFNAYKEAKEQQAKVLAERWKDKIDERVYLKLINFNVSI